METKQKTTLTQGSVARGMLLFALPIFISNLFQQLYNAADSLIVGAAQSTPPWRWAWWPVSG